MWNLSSLLPLNAIIQNTLPVSTHEGKGRGVTWSGTWGLSSPVSSIEHQPISLVQQKSKTKEQKHGDGCWATGQVLRASGDYGRRRRILLSSPNLIRGNRSDLWKLVSCLLWSECLYLPNSCVGTLTPKMILLEDGDFGKWQGYENGSLMDGVRAFAKETHCVRTQWEDRLWAGLHQASNLPWSRTFHCSVRNQYLLFVNHPICDLLF